MLTVVKGDETKAATKTKGKPATATKKVVKKAAAKKQVAKKTAAKKAVVSKKAVRKKAAGGAAPRKKQAAKSLHRTINARERYEMIAKMAYFRAEKRNFEPGWEQQDWFESERIIDEMLSRVAADN